MAITLTPVTQTTSGLVADQPTNAAIAQAAATAAAASAATASTASTTAVASAAAALISETNAATSAANAATSETNAATSASNAATSETNAAASSSTASTAASNAATSATNSANSATAAAGSATTAATQAGNASASATAASGSATAAASSATAASGSATSAAGSAADALTSANNAAASEAAALSAVVGDVGAATHIATSKATPVDADELPLADSAASFSLKKLTFANLWAWVQSKLASPGPIGGTTPALGTFLGVTDGSAAAAGVVREYVESIVLSGSAVPLTTGTATNVTTLSLSAGDWDVYGSGAFSTAVTTSVSRIQVSISTTSATSGADSTQITFPGGSVLNTVGNGPPRLAAPSLRVNSATPITVYLVALSGFTVSTCSAFGKIWARRR